MLFHIVNDRHRRKHSMIFTLFLDPGRLWHHDADRAEEESIRSMHRTAHGKLERRRSGCSADLVE
jgi:hypothetical protein